MSQKDQFTASKAIPAKIITNKTEVECFICKSLHRTNITCSAIPIVHQSQSLLMWEPNYEMAHE